jgi:pyruvate-formate lyase-activating enzyme
MVLGKLNRFIPFSLVDGPGNRFVLFLQGCNFDCVACHNPQTIAQESDEAELVTVAGILEEVRKRSRFISGVTVSGGEATQQSEFVMELFTAIRKDPELVRLTNYVDTNGSAPRRVWDLLRPVTDGVMVDLKALDPTVHMALTGRPNAPVLGSIRYLAEIGLLKEVRLLIIPGFNDSMDAVRLTADWLRSVDPNVHVKLIGFRKHGTRFQASEFDEPGPGALLSLAEEYQSEGLRGVAVV